MDIGVPYRDLGPVDPEPLLSHVRSLSDEDWRRNPLRQDLFADGVHSVSQAIILKHEWHPSNNSVGYRYIEDPIHAWGVRNGVDPAPFMPVERQDTDIGPVYTFPDWVSLRPLVEPVVERVVDKVRTRTGIVTRVALVRLSPGGRIGTHRDGQPMAARAHRLHLPLVVPPNVFYKVGGRKFDMKAGHVYDFNNRWPHSVRHDGKRPRVNLFVDYYPDPRAFVPDPFDMGPVHAKAAARTVR